MIISRTPLRISLVGGGTDVPSFYKKYPGAVVSFSINKYVWVSMNKKFDNKIRVSYSQTENVDNVDQIKHDLVRETLRLFKTYSGVEITSVSDIPGGGTGLGSSSSFTVGLIKAHGRDVPPGILAERAFEVEATRCLHPVGKQDQYAAAYGGINHMIFWSNHVEVNSIMPSEAWLKEFESHCLLLWTGITRDANEILAKQSKTFRDGGNLEIGIEMARLANDFHFELSGGADMQRIGEFLQEGWKIKKFFANGISNEKIDVLYNKAIEAGAYGGKLLGAGGGGFLFFMAPPEIHESISRATKLEKVNFKIEHEGSKVIYE